MLSSKVTRRDLLAIAGAAGLVQSLPARANEGAITFAVNEGVTYAGNSAPFAERFQGVQDDLHKLLKRPVHMVSVADYKQLAAGLGSQQYDLAWVHPAHHAIHALRTGYHLVALTKGYTDYRVSFLVGANSTSKSLTELRAARLGAPDEDSITSVIARATLREALGGELPRITYVRYQDAVPFMVEHGLADSGVTASGSVVKAWQDKGGKVLARSKPVPIKQLLASRKTVNDQQLAQVRKYFAELSATDAGKKRLEPLGVQGFEEFDEQVLAGIGTWLGA